MTRSRLVFLMLLISLFKIPANWAYSTEVLDNGTEKQSDAIDVRQFDPFDLFQRMMEEGPARDKSLIRNCYNGPKMDFSFASLADDNKENPSSDYDTVSNRNGQTYHISRRPILDKNDIDIICIDKTSYKGSDQYSIILFFKESSWDKVYDVTQSLIKKRIACLKSRTVLSAPRVFQALAQSAQIAILNKATEVESFIQALTPVNSPDSSREKAYVKWLEGRLQRYPDDSELLDSLARLYAKTKPDCKKAVSIYEQIMRINASNLSYYLPMLNSCYQDSRDFKRAVNYYKSLLSQKNNEAMIEAYLHVALASAYDGNRDRQNALQELSLAVAATKRVPTSYPWLENSPSKDKVEKKLQDDKAHMLKLLEAEIENIKAQKQ